ncbi:type I secretion system permease/ATPase [Rhizobiaceae bacterium BDR2-2]|uniref:Type I secretion system permease/ATPase n=1 Tax=Ectorhizobium quercum TaxID=2965071 RepID=A0AAE3MXX1_9HYPH|nr:type I secretion system permease/ATPase [Ectorhizobium quercum]MCX8995492.1 type I secretion system permease/ATPase [Ectorhizobium quercum]
MPFTDIPPLFPGSVGWLESLRLVAQHYRLALSVQGVKQAAASDMTGSEQDRVRNIARNMGLRIKFLKPGRLSLSGWHLPAILKMKTGEVAVIHAISETGEASVSFGGEEGLERAHPLDALLAGAEVIAIARPARTVADARVDTYIQPYEEHWLRRIVLRDMGAYGHVLIASLIANALGLTGVLFSMQVYDRVVPAQSFNTLYVLFSGVVLALLFDFLIRRVRMTIIDVLGKQADLKMSDLVFGHALRVRNRARPTSTGSFIAQLRDLEQVRELMTSTTVAALADLPFFFLFLVIFWFIGGILVLVPLTALFLLVLPGLLLQRRLRTYANEAMREASLRNAMLVEAVQGIEDIKTLQAEDRFQHQWNHYNAVTGEAQMRLRGLTKSLGIWTQNIQTCVYVVIVFAGAPMIIAGDMTTGALVGASILGSRMMAPMGQLSQIAGRFQQARIAKKGLDRIMEMPVDHPASENRIHRPKIEGSYRFKGATFRYGDDASPVALSVRDLKIDPGETIALIGKNGAGKSTLLLAMSGLLEPSAGEVLLDDLALGHIDPADIRRDVGLLTQNSRLFFGTLRDNIMMGAPHASAEEIGNALAMVGADAFVNRLPKGLEHVIQEGGQGLSGGQKQALLLARLLIREPTVILLDEPTAAMDEATERNFIEQFARWSAGRTVIVATHRMRVLELVNRLIVVENGMIALDEPKEKGLQALTGVRKVSPDREPGQMRKAAASPAGGI